MLTSEQRDVLPSDMDEKNNPFLKPYNLNESIRFNEPFLSGLELSSIQECFNNNFFSGNGPFTKKCQEILSNFLKADRVLLTHSCTAALEMSAMLLDLNDGDEIIMPSYTFCSTASAFLRERVKIVFCEIDPSTMLMSADDVEKKITKKTKGVVAVHYGGLAAPVFELRALCKANNLRLIEDCAQGLGTNINNEYLGTIGDFGCLSFHETKNIHSGLGGALIVSHADADRAENIWERGTNRIKMHRGLVDKYSWVDKGSSFYPTELQAAFLYGQLQAYWTLDSIRKKLHERYMEQLAPLEKEGFFLLPQNHADYLLNYHSAYIICQSQEASDALRGLLLKHHIHAFIGYVPLHSSKMGLAMGYQPEDLPITQACAPQVIRLPFHHRMRAEHVDKVCSVIQDYYL